MGLSIGIGDLALALADDAYEEDEIEEVRALYAGLDQLLRSRGFPGHLEPERLPSIPSRGALEGFPYSWIHFLRRAYVYHCLGRPLEPYDADRAADDPVLDAEYDRVRYPSNLVHFSDAEGFYVPIDFAAPLVAEDPDEVLGGAVGSSVRLLEELRAVAPSIDLSLEAGRLTDSLADQLSEERAGQDVSFCTERQVWFTLFEAATQSIQYNSAIRLG